MLLPNGVYACTPLDKRGIGQNELNIATKLRSNPLPWGGQFTPQLVEVLLGRYGRRGGSVLDPFAGSGTALAEAACLGMTAVGAEINPAAIALAGLYQFINIPAENRGRYIALVERQLGRILPEQLPFSSTIPAP